jgi:biopolymer transport protein ExbD
MRFSRNTKIFRGGVDAAPFAGVFFLLVLFLMLFYSHVFFPGVPIQLADQEGAPELASRSAKVLASGEVVFLGMTYSVEEFKVELRTLGQRGTLPRRLIIEAEPQADQALTAEVENLLKGAGINLKYPGTRLDLANDAGFPGAATPVVVVGINLNGQLFFQHQLVSESTLEERLTTTVRQTAAPMTLVLQADKNVTTERIVRLSQIANRAGIAELRIATKPPGT